MISLSPGLALGDLRNGLQQVFSDQRDRHAGAFGRGPQPVEAAVGEPGLLVRLVERETQPAYARLTLDPVDPGLAVGLVEREVGENREAVRVLACGLDRERVGVRIPARRMDHGRVHAGIVHFFQHVRGREVEDLAMVGIRRLVAGPDVDLGVDYQHTVLPAFLAARGRFAGRRRLRPHDDGNRSREGERACRTQEFAPRIHDSPSGVRGYSTARRGRQARKRSGEWSGDQATRTRGGVTSGGGRIAAKPAREQRACSGARASAWTRPLRGPRLRRSGRSCGFP